MPKQKVLEILLNSKSEYISGEKISEKLNVSRAAICKDIKQLKNEGYTIEAITKKGYRLVEESPYLDLTSIKSRLQSDLYTDNIILLDSIDSTNTYAKTLAMKGATNNTIIIARQQTGGRGRMGKSFLSPNNVGLYISLILRPDIMPMEAINLTSYAAVATAKAIEKVCGICPDIKWVNDLVMNNKKICGILTEMSIEGESGKIEYIVLGIGINVLQKKSDFDISIQHIASSVSEASGKDVSLNALAAALIDEFEPMHDAWLDNSSEYKDFYREHCISLTNPLLVGEDKRPAKAISLDDDFRLLVRYENGETELRSAGEISVVGFCGA